MSNTPPPLHRSKLHKSTPIHTARGSAAERDHLAALFNKFRQNMESLLGHDTQYGRINLTIEIRDGKLVSSEVTKTETLRTDQ